MCNLHQSKMSEATPTLKYGYLEVKQSSKVRPRKLKSWRRRWAVLTKLSNLSCDQYEAKLDLYESEAKWKDRSVDKMTFVFENVTCIQRTKSKTHQYAFEIVEKQPVLVLSGATELESYAWILALQQMLTPEQIETKKDTYQVTMSPNEHSTKWGLSGQYTLNVSPACISLVDKEGMCIISWGLSTLMRFNVDKNSSDGSTTMLVIECGPNAPTGQSCFWFKSEEAEEILSAIRQSICLALAQKQNTRTADAPRARSLSATVSEKGFQSLLSNTPASPNLGRERSSSESSNSLANVGSPTHQDTGVPQIPLPGSPASLRRASSGLGIVHETDEQSHGKCEQSATQEQLGQINESHKRSLSLPRQNSRSSNKTQKNNSGYSEIKDVSGTDEKGRGATTNSDPSDIDSDRLRSVSFFEVHDKHIRSVSFEDDADDKSDLDSAISSMAHSVANGESPRKDQPLYQDLDEVTFNQYPEGPLNRKRSSSTPDLQAYRKHHDAIVRFENVYEELDELRASVKRMNKTRSAETPPELPARPVSMSMSSNPEQTVKTNVKKKRSLFKSQEKASSLDSTSQTAKDKTNKTCVCESEGRTRTASFSSCEHHVTQTTSKSRPRTQSMLSKSPSKEQLMGSIDSSLNELYATIPELSKRRRSSDITPVKSLFPEFANKSPAQRVGFADIHENETKKSVSFKTQDNRGWVEFGASTDGYDKRLLHDQAIPAPIHCSAADPLISFFLNDEEFETNPMVTGQLTSASQQPSNFDLLTTNDFETSSPQQVSANPTLTQTRSQTQPMPIAQPANQFGQNLHSNSQFGQDFHSGMMLSGSPASPFSPLDIWGVNVIGNNGSPNSSNFGSFPPPFHSLPHMQMQSYTWNQPAPGLSALPAQTFPSSQVPPRESNYMVMQGRGGGIAGQSINSGQNHVNAAGISQNINSVPLSGSNMDDIYVSPSSITKKK